MLYRSLLIFLILTAGHLRGFSISILHYNVAGNGTTNWSTNALQVQAIGRQMLYCQPDIVTFNEIPRTNTWQMANFITAYLPGYFLATNSGTDGFIRSAIASRHPLVRSQSWLDGVSLVPFGYTNSPSTFTRDLFEAEISVPGWTEHLHVFTTHLKAADTGTNFALSLHRRAAEASAISNFLVVTFLPSHPHRPYLLSGDMNEDIAKPPSGSGTPLLRLINPSTDLRLTTPVSRGSLSSNTYSIRKTPSERIDYILPCALLFSNIASSQVFRTDELSPLPPNIFTSDSKTASDHLPVFISFYNPYEPAPRISTPTLSNQFLNLAWTATTGRSYRVEFSTNVMQWTAASSNLVALNTNMSWNAPQLGPYRFYRIQRLP